MLDLAGALAIDDTSAEPPYLQVREQIAGLVADAALVPGDRLPPVRALAEALGLAANTVARAYKELEAAGVVETRGRAGTLVRARDVTASGRAAAVDFVEQMRRLGVPDDEIVADVRRALG